MPTRPTEDPPRWATNDIIDQVTGGNNVIEPPEEKKDAGWNRGEYPAREWFNWFMRGTGQWLQFLGETASGTPITTITVDGTGNDALPEADAELQYAGLLFVLDGSDTTHWTIGFLRGDAGEWFVQQIANNTLALNAISGRNVTVTGGDAEDLAIFSIVFPATVVNA